MIPSRTKQIEAVAAFLDSDFQEGKSLDDIAASIVDGYLSALTKGISKPAQPLRAGMLIRTPDTSKVSRLVWVEGDLGWFVTEDSNYGMLASISSPYWRYCEEYRPKKRIEADGKKKLVEMTDEDIAEQWDNPDWSVGDTVSMSQRMFSYTILAVAPRSVLLEDGKTGKVYADSTANLSRYYRREANARDDQW